MFSTNTHVPAPFWSAVVPTKIPLSSCNQAADTLIEWFGPEELKHVVGGERWWQVRGLEWIDAEWITEKDYLEDGQFDEDAKYTDEEKTILRMEHLDRVMVNHMHCSPYLRHSSMFCFSCMFTEVSGLCIPGGIFRTEDRQVHSSGARLVSNLSSAAISQTC